MRVPILILLFLIWAVSSLAETPDANHSVDSHDDKAKAPEVRLLTRQEALVKGLKEAGLTQVPLQRLAKIFENRPRATPEQFSTIVDAVSEEMQGLISEKQKNQLKKLYAEELGAVKGQPGVEFAAAAKLLTTTLSVPDPAEKGFNPNAAIDPNSTVNQLNGATVVHPSPDAKGLPPDLTSLVDKATKAALAEIQKNTQGQLLQAQALLQKLQEQAQGADRQGRGSERRSLLDSLAGLLKDAKEDGKKEEGGSSRAGEDPSRGNSRNETHAATPLKTPSDDKDKKDRPGEIERRTRDRDRDRDRSRNQGQPSINISNGGEKNAKAEEKPSYSSFSSGEFKKKDKDKGDLLKNLDEKKEPTEDQDPNSEALSAAQNLLAKAKSLRPKVNLGESKPLDPLPPASGSSALDAGAGAAADPNANSPAMIANGGGSSFSGGGGGLEGNPFQGLGEDPYGSGAGGASYTFANPVQFGSASAAGTLGPDAPETVDGGGEEPENRPRAKTAPNTPALALIPALAKGKGWVLDFVGNVPKHLCTLPDAYQIGWCEKVFSLKRKLTTNE